MQMRCCSPQWFKGGGLQQHSGGLNLPKAREFIKHEFQRGTTPAGQEEAPINAHTK